MLTATNVEPDAVKSGMTKIKNGQISYNYINITFTKMFNKNLQQSKQILILILFIDKLMKFFISERL